MVVLSDDVGITALLQAMTCQGERDCEQGVSVARTEVPVHEALQFEHHRAEYRNCGQPWHHFGQAPELESDGTEELRVPECVRIADRHEHTAESALVKFLKREIRK